MTKPVSEMSRDELWVKATTEALDLLTEIWPRPAGQGVYLTADQWTRLRQVLLWLPELGD